MNMECTKSDWKLFRELIPEWQEAYMERLNKEYISCLAAKRMHLKSSGRLRRESGRTSENPVSR